MLMVYSSEAQVVPSEYASGKGKVTIAFDPSRRLEIELNAVLPPRFYRLRKNRLTAIQAPGEAIEAFLSRSKK